jgi:hypothetical protein
MRMQRAHGPIRAAETGWSESAREIEIRMEAGGSGEGLLLTSRRSQDLPLCMSSGTTEPARTGPRAGRQTYDLDLG